MNRPSRIRRGAALLAVIAAVLGLSGCFKASQDVKVKADGSGSVVLHGELNKKAFAAIVKSFGDIGGLGGTAPDMDAPFRPVDRTFPDGTKVRTVDSADRATLDASFDFNGSDEYRRKMRQINQAIAPDAGASAFAADDGSIQIRRVEDRMEVTLDVGSTAEAGDVDLSSLNGLLDPEALPTVVVTITMPGAILGTNGKADGRTVTWDLLRPNAPPTLTASSKIAKPGLPAWALPTGAGLILVLLLAMIGVVLSKRSRAATASPPVVPYQPGPDQPPAQPGTGSFFPPSQGPLPREPVGWPATSPGEATSPPAAPSPWAPTPAAREPVGPVPPPPPSEAGSPWGTPPPTAGDEPAQAGLATPAPEPPVVDPLPWRVPGAPAAPAATSPLPPDPQPQPQASSPEPGWYSDPGGSGGVRYWDGRQWTQHTR